MINLNTSKTLNIVLPNTNKALNEVVKSITPQELETLSKGRDLKSIVSTLLQQSANDSSGDKKLLFRFLCYNLRLFYIKERYAY